MPRGEGIQFPRGDVQKGGHLVDERAGPAGTGAVHPLFYPAGQEEDFCVLPAQLDDDVDIRVKERHRFAGGVDLLDKLDAGGFGKAEAGRSRQGDPERPVPDRLSGCPEQFPRLLADLGKVTFVPFKEDLLPLHHDHFNSGRTDINPDVQTHSLLSPSS